MSCRRFFVQFLTWWWSFLTYKLLYSKRCWGIVLEISISSDSFCMFFIMKKAFRLFIALQIGFWFLFRMSIFFGVDIFSMIRLFFFRWKEVSVRSGCCWTRFSFDTFLFVFFEHICSHRSLVCIHTEILVTSGIDNWGLPIVMEVYIIYLVENVPVIDKKNSQVVILRS